MASRPINSKRYIRQMPDGRWGVYRERDVRSFDVYESVDKAVRRARDLVRAEGGGYVLVMDTYDKQKYTHRRYVTARPSRTRSAAAKKGAATRRAAAATG